MKPLKWTVIGLAIGLALFTFIPTQHSADEVTKGFMATTVSRGNVVYDPFQLLAAFDLEVDAMSEDGKSTVISSAVSGVGKWEGHLFQYIDTGETVPVEYITQNDFFPFRTYGHVGEAHADAYNKAVKKYANNSWHPLSTPQYVWHAGTDLGCRNINNTYQTAMWDGEIVEVSNTRNDGRGAWVTVKHTEHFYTLYQHLVYDSTLVKVGDKVAAGTPLGKSGSSGNSTGTHAHIELIVCEGDYTTGQGSYYGGVANIIWLGKDLTEMKWYSKQTYMQAAVNLEAITYEYDELTGGGSGT